MTQNSFFHNGYQIGDASYYSAEAYHKILSDILAGQSGFVVPSGSVNTLGVSFVAGQTVSVEAGSAFVAGVYYNNSALKNIVLENNPATTNRIDRVVIQVDWTAQTARVVAKRGAASSTPVAPALQQEIGNIYEISLAAILVTPSFAGFGDEYIYDERDYLLLPEDNKSTKNVMFNSEFMSGPSPAFSDVPFPMWRTTGITSVSYSRTGAKKFEGQSRGRSLNVVLPSGDDFYTSIYLNNGVTTRATLSFIIQVASGGPVDFSVDGGATTLYTIPITQDPIVVIARVLVGAAGGNQAIEPHFSSAAIVNTTFKLGQMTVAFGNNYAPFEHTEELVLQPYPYSLVSSDIGDSGLTIYSLNQDVMWQGVKNAVIQHYYIDTLSATQDDVYAIIQNEYISTTSADINGIEIGRLTNSLRRYGHGVIPLELPYDSRSPTDFWSVAVILNPAGVHDWNLDLMGVQT